MFPLSPFAIESRVSFLVPACGTDPNKSELHQVPCPASGEASLGRICNLLEVWRGSVQSAGSVLYALRSDSLSADRLPLRPPPALSRCSTPAIRLAVSPLYRTVGNLWDYPALRRPLAACGSRHFRNASPPPLTTGTYTCSLACIIVPGCVSVSADQV